jgi:hypothetical protein
VVLSLTLFSCGGKDDKKKEGGGDAAKETPASIAKQWCDLNGIAHKAAEGAEKDAAKAAVKQFEKSMEAKYDKDFMKQVEDEAEKCEAASEGR